MKRARSSAGRALRSQRRDRGFESHRVHCKSVGFPALFFCGGKEIFAKAEELKKYIKQRYIFVSRITGGTQATGLGNAAQIYAERYFQEKLGDTYIIDGAGNFQRESALTTICQYSHCTIAYTDKEFDVLIEFIREKIG